MMHARLTEFNYYGIDYRLSKPGLRLHMRGVITQHVLSLSQASELTYNLSLKDKVKDV